MARNSLFHGADIVLVARKRILERLDRRQAIPLKILKQPVLDLFDEGSGAFG
jgi:hypothetical protein